MDLETFTDINSEVAMVADRKLYTHVNLVTTWGGGLLNIGVSVCVQRLDQITDRLKVQ